MRRLLTSCAFALCAAAFSSAAVSAPFDVLDFDQDSTDMNGPSVVAPSPDGRHVYVCAETGSTLVGYAVDGATGTLSRVDLEVDDNLTVDGLGGCSGVAISPDGRFVYTTGQNDWGIGIFSRDPETGLLTYLDLLATEELAETDALRQPTALAASPDGSFLYVTLRGPDAVTVLARNPTTGLLSLVEVERNPPGGFLQAPTDVTVSADGAFVYVTADGELPGGGFADALLTFARDATTGEITLVDTDRQGSGLAFPLLIPKAVATTRDGRDVYVAAAGINAIVAFARTPDANPTQYFGFVDEFSPGLEDLRGPASLAITSDDAYVIAAAYAADAVIVLQRDPDTGGLAVHQSISNDPTKRLNGVADVAIDPLRRFVYVAALLDDALTVFAPEPGAAALGAAAIAALAVRKRFAALRAG